MVDPSTKAIKESVEHGTSFVEWLVDVLRGKSWVKKLLLLDVVILAIFNPAFFPTVLKFFTDTPLPPRYPLFFWLVVGLIFVASVAVALRTLPKPAQPARELDRRSAIKGLLSFTLKDAELFTRLQRQEGLRECIQAVTDDDYHFGVLCGESGCGKSSFLQAGLWPRLLKQNHRCAYVKFSDLDPLDSMRAAITEQLGAPKSMVEDADFLTLLKAAAGEDPKPLVLLFDQFEQFFVHRRRDQERAPFVEALAAWYGARRQLPVKILICLRGDFYDHLIELQKAMGYTLGPQQSHRLRRFNSAEATEIFRVIAETEGMAFDEAFVEELTETELASREDGLISPVDIQILAWMISGWRAGEERAFSRSTYQKFGGIEGLLEVFLGRVLEARETEARRQAAVKILLALTDLERNVRAGAMTLEMLKEKLAGTVPNAEIEEAARWLGRPDVRLVIMVKRNDGEGYELAHERLIPALRKIAGKSLSHADQANHLLDRRVNEWLGNNRARRYLLTWREWRLIEKQRPYLIWGAQRQHKESLLAHTKRRWRILTASASLPLAAAACFLIWWSSELGQLYRIKEEALRYRESGNKSISTRDVLTGLTYAGWGHQAIQLAQREEDPEGKAMALVIVAEAAATAGDTQRASALLRQSLMLAERVEGLFERDEYLAFIALVAGKGGDIQLALELAERLEDPEGKARVLAVVAKAAAKAGDTQQALRLLGQALEAAEKIITPVSRQKDQALVAIAAAAAKVGDLKMARSAALRCETDEGKAVALSRILIAWAERKGLVAEGEIEEWRG